MGKGSNLWTTIVLIGSFNARFGMSRVCFHDSISPIEVRAVGLDRGKVVTAVVLYASFHQHDAQLQAH